MAFKFSEKLSDGSEVFNVAISLEGGRDLVVHCVDEQAADNLVSVWEHSSIGADLVRGLPYELDPAGMMDPDGAAFLED